MGPKKGKENNWGVRNSTLGGGIKEMKVFSLQKTKGIHDSSHK